MKQRFEIDGLTVEADIIHEPAQRQTHYDEGWAESYEVGYIEVNGKEITGDLNEFLYERIYEEVNGD